MQIVNHLIRSVETHLGIPSEHMLEKHAEEKVPQDDDGVAAIIDAVMHREAQTTASAVHGRGGVPALRKEMDTIKQLLEQIPL